MRFLHWPGAAALALAAGLAAAGGDERVLATANGTAITLGHVATLREALPEQYQALPDEVLFRAILEQLIQQTVLAQAIDNTLDARETAGLENARRDFLARVAIDRAGRAAATEAAVLEAYRTRYAEAAPTTEWNAAHILVSTEDEARAILAAIEAGADFAAKAQERSQDPGSAQAGGALGWFGPGMMVAPFEAALEGLEPGQVSDPVQTQFGWHLVKLIETRIATVPPIEAVRAEIADALARAAVEARIAELMARATVTRSDDGVDPALIRDQTLFD